MDDGEQHQVLVQTVDVRENGRQISWGDGLVERLGSRSRDVRNAIQEGTRAVSEGVSAAVSPDGWHLEKISASFGITLAAEAGVLLSKAGAEATFEVNVTYSRAAAPTTAEAIPPD